MNEGDICLHLESAQMQEAEKLFQTCELYSPRYKFVIGKAEMRSLLNKTFYKEIIGPVLTRLTSKVGKLASLRL